MVAWLHGDKCSFVFGVVVVALCLFLATEVLRSHAISQCVVCANSRSVSPSRYDDVMCKIRRWRW